ncbi:MAG: PepSY domain-containing protein [Dehalococcoidia bacterium]|nr:PepSY domain-containing protein [Dehalococcoidia bacterium]
MRTLSLDSSRIIAIGAASVLAITAVAGTFWLREAGATPLRQQADELLPIDEVVAIAQRDGGSGTATDVEIERRGDQFVYEVDFGRTEVRLDAKSGAILDIRNDDDDDDDDRQPDESASLPAGSITPGAAIAAAEAAVSGRAEDIEIDWEAGQLVYVVEIGETEVFVDPVNGTVVGTETD